MPLQTNKYMRAREKKSVRGEGSRRKVCTTLGPHSMPIVSRRGEDACQVRTTPPPSPLLFLSFPFGPPPSVTPINLLMSTSLLVSSFSNATDFQFQFLLFMQRLSRALGYPPGFPFEHPSCPSTMPQGSLFLPRCVSRQVAAEAKEG